MSKSPGGHMPGADTVCLPPDALTHGSAIEKLPSWVLSSHRRQDTPRFQARRQVIRVSSAATRADSYVRVGSMLPLVRSPLR